MIAINKDPSPAELRKFAFGIVLGFAVLAALCWWVMPRLFHAKTATGTAATHSTTAALAASEGETPRGSSPETERWHKVALVMLGIGIVVAAVATLTPRNIAVPFYVVWMQIAVAIGNVTTPIFFTILFVIMLPFFSLIRLADPLRFKLKPGARETYWEDHRDHEDTIERAMRPF